MKTNSNGGEAGAAIETAVCSFFLMAIAAFNGNHAYLQVILSFYYYFWSKFFYFDEVLD